MNESNGEFSDKKEDSEDNESIENTQPGERLRRLLSQENDETELPSELEGELDIPEEDSVLDEGLFMSQEGKEEENSAEIQRHPTGEPESTGGWFGEVNEDGSEIESERPKAEAGDEDTNPLHVPLRTEEIKEASEEETIPPSGEFLDNQLPKRVDQEDKFATRVSPAAFKSPSSSTTRVTPVSRPSSSTARPINNVAAYAPRKKKKRQPSGQNQALGCLFRMAIALLFVFVFVLVILSSIAVYQYYSILSSLPEIEGLQNRASQFETTRILDRNGNELYEVLDPNAGRRTYIPLEQMSPNIIAATIATEDKEFYNHPGYDPIALIRALWQNYTNQEIVSGASTITQQLARTLLFSPSERYERSYQRKAREIVLAAEITRKYSKEEILELYLNENNYGYLAYGVEAAAETYFHTTADQLSLAQATFLAGIPQAPSVYDIFTNREETLRRHEDVVVLTYQLSQEKGCIYVSNSIQPVCVDAGAATNALEEIKNYNFELDQNIMRFPHWVNYIRMLLESQFDAQTIYRSGFTVYTTLDPDLQDSAEQIVRQQVEALADRNVNGGALVAIRPTTGEILAMVGSPDFYNEVNSGQVNMAINPRQPGSAIKPLTYTAAFEKGWTPSTLIWDVPTDFPPSGDPNDPSPPYQPVNYDGRFHGPVTLRDALANSYNVPAVKALDFVGIYDNPATPAADGLINLARRMGITTLNRPDYGLSLTLGGGEVTLLELTNAYAAFANNGRYLSSVAILKIVDHEGNVVYEYSPPGGSQVIRQEHAYLINSILSDNAARTPMFGANSVLNLPFSAAAKTGTTNDFRDNWTIGYTPDLAVGVWIGNPDYTPMLNTTGLSGAAPIWSAFIQQAIPKLTGGFVTPFVRPSGIVDEVVCEYSGTLPSEWCPTHIREIFAVDQPPLPKTEDLWIKVNIDTWTGLEASSQCSDYTSEEFALNVSDPWAKKWVLERNQGKEWARSIGFDEPIFFVPNRECRFDDPRPRILFAGIDDGQTIVTNPLDIYALITATDHFKEYRLEYGLGEDPVEWKALIDHVVQQHDPPDRIYTWDLSDITAELITLRIYVESTKNTFAEQRIQLNIQVPTKTPTPTSTLTITPTNTQTPTITHTPTITSTPTLTQVPPSSTPTATATPTSTSTITTTPDDD